MQKIDYPPVFASGIHAMTLEMIGATFVDPDAADTSRLRLFSLFDQWVHRLRQLNITGTIWLDGSFVTRKPAPQDMDCVLWYPAFVEPISEAGKIEARSLTDRDTAKAQFGIDLYIEQPEYGKRMAREAYWRGLFGYQHDGRRANGFVELKV